jgi:hypothetical protein
MARFSTSGIDEIIDQMKGMGALISPTADRMLMRGAEEVKKAWKLSAAMHGFRHTGDMINSVGYRKKPDEVEGIKRVDIYPQGKDRKGIRNAEKAFYLHYGTSKVAASNWVDEADELSADPVQAVMEDEFDQFLREKGMIR